MKLVLLFFSILCGCTAHPYKSISLKRDESVSYFVIQLEKADLYFSKEDVFEGNLSRINTETDQSRKKEALAIYDRLKQSDSNLYNIPGKLSDASTKESVEDYLFVGDVQYTLLRQGKVKVYNRLSKRYESDVQYKIIKSKLGSKSAVFSFPDGTAFYYQVISLGE